METHETQIRTEICDEVPLVSELINKIKLTFCLLK